MQEDLLILNKYFGENSLKLNAEKTNYVIIKNHYDINLNLVVDGKIIKKVDSMKYLGLKINNKFNWIDHADYVKQSISPYCGMLKK